MRLWIAIIAGLSMGQSLDVESLPPEDPSVRDPAASSLQDAYEQAADDLDGARPPEGYAIQTPTDPTQSNYRGVTPLLPDGSAPVTSGEVAVQQSQTYVPPPVPTFFEQQPASGEAEESQPQTGTGGAGAAGTSPTSGPTNEEAPGFGGTYETGATSSTVQGSVAPGGTGEQPLNTAQVPVQEPGTATGGAGAAGTTGTEAAPAQGTPPPAQGGTAAETPSNQTAQPAQGAQGQAQPTQETAANAAATDEELNRLHQRIADLEQEVEARDAQATERTQSVQTQVDTHEQRAYEVERARQQRLARIQSGGQWMLAADQALEQGELGVDNALSIADEDFSVVGQSASSFGQGNVEVYAQRIRAQIALARDAANRRDIYAARIALQDAGDALRLARAANLERSSTSNTLLNP
ncbi:hypothetical protein [Corallococcus sp. EGB]|uniref:hypothetical protein n=1 Tax=Corallococcus sp. EGB TaxID=1521117 RepID=UPI001CBC0F65|nr:hypothetical protein [Corallococcus sp. EGB]